MEKQSPGQIYLADSRGITETTDFIRWSTFNYGTYTGESRHPFGALRTLNDEVFMPGHHSVYNTDKNIFAVVIPVTGEVAVNGQTVDVGEVLVQYVEADGGIELRNTYTEERINFLYLEIEAWHPGDASPRVFEFDMGAQRRLTTVINNDQLPFTLYIGLFGGREEALYKLKEKDALFFAFVIAGAFETQGRLLHQRDGLALWDLQEADMEALSNNAVMLVLETKKADG